MAYNVTQSAKDLFFQTVWQAIEPWTNRPDFSRRDGDMIKAEIHRFYDEGWTVTEAKMWLKCTEEVNPMLDEDTALARMRTIRDDVYIRKQREANEHQQTN